MRSTSTLVALMAIFGAHISQCMPHGPLEHHTPQNTSSPSLDNAILGALSKATHIETNIGPRAKAYFTEHDTFWIWFGSKKTTFDIYGADWDNSLRDGKHKGIGLKYELEMCGPVSDWEGHFDQLEEWAGEWDFHVKGKIMSRATDCFQQAIKNAGGPPRVDIGHQLKARDTSAESGPANYYLNNDGTIGVSALPDSDSPTTTASPESAMETVTVGYYESAVATVKPKLVFNEKVAWAFEPIYLDKALAKRMEKDDVLKTALPVALFSSALFLGGPYFVVNWLGAQKKAVEEAAKTAVDTARPGRVAQIAQEVYMHAYDVLIRPDAMKHGLYDQGDQSLDAWVEEQVKDYIKGPGKDASPIEPPSLEPLDLGDPDLGEYLGSHLFKDESQAWDWMFDVSDSFSHLSEDSITSLHDAIADAAVGKFTPEYENMLTDMTAPQSPETQPGTPDPAYPADPPNTPEVQPGTPEPVEQPNTPISDPASPDAPAIPGWPALQPEVAPPPSPETPESQSSTPEPVDSTDTSISYPSSPETPPMVAPPVIAPPVVAPPVVAPPIVAPPIVAPPIVVPPVVAPPVVDPSLFPHGIPSPFGPGSGGNNEHHNSGNGHHESEGEHHENGEHHTASATKVSTTSAPHSTTKKTTTKASSTHTSKSTTKKTTTKTSSTRTSTSSTTTSTSKSSTQDEEPTATSAFPSATTSTSTATPRAALNYHRTGKNSHHKYAFTLGISNLPAYERTPKDGIQTSTEHLKSGIEKCGDLDKFDVQTSEHGESKGWDFKIDGVIKGSAGEKKHFALGCFREAIMAAGGPGDIEGVNT